MAKKRMAKRLGKNAVGKKQKKVKESFLWKV
jgi:hypothetical protein